MKHKVFELSKVKGGYLLTGEGEQCVANGLTKAVTHLLNISSARGADNLRVTIEIIERKEVASCKKQ